MATKEEKARAYDEALKVLHKYDGAHIMFTQDLKEEMFPELREVSGDERIRKALIKYYSFNKDGGSHALDNITPEQILAWLEAQGEQKPVDKVELKFKVGDLIKLSKEPKYPAREIISIKNDGYYFDSAVYLPFERQDDWELEKPSIKKDQWIPQSGDRIRKKETIKPIYLLYSKTDLGFRFVEEREVGIAGGELSFWDLKENYELVERPKTIEEALDELFEPFMSHIKENGQKPSTIKFEEEPVFDGMVYEYIKSKEEVGITGKELTAYRQGLEDMWNKLKSK